MRWFAEPGPADPTPDEVSPPAVAPRNFQAAEPASALRDSLTEKMLSGWLQNRQQTLFPLTVNLRTLDPPRVELLLRVAALAVAVGPPADDARLQTVRSWLLSVGAASEHLLAFTDAVSAPMAPGHLLHELQSANLGAYAYAVSLGALDQRDAHTQPFLDFLAARLAVPVNVVRSVRRRQRTTLR